MNTAASGTEAARIREHLKGLAAVGQVEIGLSYHIVFELLQKADPEYREDRLARARLLKELCGQNAFAYGRDLGKGYVFSKQGIWVPRWALDEFEIERLVRDLLQNLSRDQRLTREQRRRLSKRKHFEAYVRSDLTVLKLMPGKMWPLPFGRELAESGDLRRYILGEISREDANRKLWVHLTDPVMFYQTWFERQGRGNPLEATGDRLARLLMELLEKHRAMLGEQSGLRAEVKKALAAKGEDALGAEDRTMLLQLQRDLKTFRDEIMSPDDLNNRVPAWRELFGEKSARVATQILFALPHYKPRLERSDAIDFAHAMYLPHTDLWRGDRGFSNLLIRNKVDCWERVVPALADLPARIEAERMKWAA
jgi:hypothetical protein